MPNDLDQLQNWVASEKNRIRSAEVKAMTEVGGLVQDELIQRLNTPYPPASVEDEDPHRRTGQLSAGIRFSVDEFNFGVVTNVVSAREGGNPNIPYWLDAGTGKMAPRRYMERTREQWESQFPQVIEGLFWGYYR